MYQIKRLNNPPFDDIIDAKRLPEGSFLVGRNEIQETVDTVSFYIPKTKRTREVRRFAKTEKPEARLGLSALARIR